MQVKYLLDTNICIYIAKYQPIEVREKFEQLQYSDLYMSVITLGELRFGAEKSQAKAKAIRVIEQLSQSIQIAELDEHVTHHYAEIRYQLQRQGQMIGGNDLWLAAHARANNWVMVTNNQSEFNRVDGLSVENWLK